MKQELGEMTERDYDENKMATLRPPVEAAYNNDVYAPPCIEIDGAQVYVYVQDGTLVVSVDLEGVGSAFRLYGEDQVPVLMTVNGETVFEANEVADVARYAPRPATVPVLMRTERPRRWWRLR